MIRVIRLSRRAMKKLDNLFVYLEEKWSEKIKHKFVLKLDKSLNKYSETTINVIAIFDNRQNPKSLKRETKE